MACILCNILCILFHISFYMLFILCLITYYAYDAYKFTYWYTSFCMLFCTFRISCGIHVHILCILLHQRVQEKTEHCRENGK